MRAREYGIRIGGLPTGKRNLISDVPGVTVGHTTLSENGYNTGVTVLLPCPDDPFTRKLPCAQFVLNGYGKTCGLMQIDELGTLETPIALTNTLNVGLVHDAMVEYMIGLTKREGIDLTSVNPLVCECNDASLNRIRDRAVQKDHVFAAIESASADFALGAVGCGRGTTCHGLKGGVGSASRRIPVGGKMYTLGVLVQTNHGRMDDLTLKGENIGPVIRQRILAEDRPDKGSCINILATDLPLSDRQLRRVIRRCSVGMARLGSFIGQSSGEVFIGFSTANRVPADEDEIYETVSVKDSVLDLCFRAAAECTEEAVLDSMLCAGAVTAEDGTKRHSLSEFADLFRT